MQKNSNLNNTLIKKKSVMLQLKKAGITRTSKDALKEISIAVNSYLNKVYSVSKEEMFINGRKTLTDKDVTNAVKKIAGTSAEKQEDSWEI